MAELTMTSEGRSQRWLAPRSDGTPCIMVGQADHHIQERTEGMLFEVKDVDRAFYQEHLPAEGWTAGAVTDLAGTYMLEFSRGDENISITIAASDGVTNVVITFQ